MNKTAIFFHNISLSAVSRYLLGTHKKNSLGVIKNVESFDAVCRRLSAEAAKLMSALCMAAALSSLPVMQAKAQNTVNIASVPILALKSAPGLVMLTMSRDHRLYYAAYNDTSDINGDGVMDVGFKPTITYYGYFVSDRCYTYDTSATPARFVPVAVASSTTGCNLVASARWHGNWMNWMATSRMDALRKVLYGGKRVVDDASTSVLEASHIPPDSHIWGKEFRPTPTGTDSYLIQNYTPMEAPESGKMHIFLMKSEGASASTYINLPAPTLRAITDVDINIDRVWLWASSERPVGGAAGTTGYTRRAGKVSNPNSASVIPYGLPGFSTGTSYSSKTFAAFVTPPTIRVEACVLINGVREAGCTGYPSATPTSWKPTGVLHDYSANDALKFGLITGSYLNNYSGGVLRKDIGSFKDEIDLSTGQFSSVVGIAKSIDRLTNYGFDISSQLYNCGFLWTSLRPENKCSMWGAPVGEMMYEGLRYFTDKQPTPAFITGVAASTSPDTRITLPTKTTWKNPFRPTTSGGSPICSRPVQMVIADPITSFDSDQLPGAAYSPAAGYGAAVTNDLTGLDVSSQADSIWNSEPDLGSASKNFFVGQSSLSNYDGNPTSKSANSFRFMRGHAPDETASQGSYYSASVAKFAKEDGVPVRTSSTATPVITPVDTISVALGSVIPRLELSYLGKTASLVPFSKMVGGCSTPASPTSTPSGFQPTGLITGVFIDRIANSPVPNSDPTINSGRPFIRFMVSFSDGDQGGDNEADANVYYTMAINAQGTLDVRLDSYYQATCAQQNMGYVISGTTRDGVYLEVRGVSAGSEVYYLDTLPGQIPTPAAGRSPANTSAISNSNATRNFTFSTSNTGATYVPHDPLWYAAKYGGSKLLDSKGDPTNYFRISNPSNLPSQMGKAFRSAAALASVASTSVVGVGQRSSGSAAVYQANYDSLTWSSRLYGFKVGTDGVVSNTPIWEASSLIGELATRTRLFLGRGGSTTPFQLSGSNFSFMTAAEQSDFGDVDTYAYLLGEKSGEERNSGRYRNRGTTTATSVSSSNGSVLGDIVNSDPQVINKKDYGYGPSDSTYAGFVAGINYEMLAVGTNNGFFHIFDAQPTTSGGGELLGFMPQAARTNVKDLADPAYAHRNFIDGPTAVGHAKINLAGDTADTWHSVVVGTGGGGVKTVFAINASSKTFAANSILWEINQSSTAPAVPALLASKFSETFGQIVGRPVIGKLGGTINKWVAIFGNGYNSTAGTANLYIVDLKDGTLLKIIPTNDLKTGNGLGSIEVVRKASDNTIDYVYGADYKGNIWRFDPMGKNNGALIYSTPTGRPITAEIRIGDAPVSPNTVGGKMIYFGTGSYLNSADATNTNIQALYGIYDGLVWTNSLTPAVAESTLSSMSLTMPSATSDLRSVSAAPSPEWYKTTGKNGWVLPLTGTNVQAGERVIAPPIRYTVAGLVDAFLFTSLVPSTNECEAGLDTWITGVDAMTGGFKKVFFGLPDKNSVRIRGGSPRGVFVLENNGKPSLYISQSVFNNTTSSTTFATTDGGKQETTIGEETGETLIKKVDLDFSTPTATNLNRSRQIWRQLK